MLDSINHGPVRELRLARAPVNALNTELVQLMIKSVREAETDCDAIVLSGQDGIFSAGLDVVELMQFDRDGIRNFWTAFFELLETIACSSIPIATAITGHSPAGGAVIFMLCDYRVMSRGEYLTGLNETRVGLVIPPVLQNAMARLVGPRVAEQMLVAGTMIGPEDALRIGFVDALETGHESTIQHAINWCQNLLALPQKSMLGNRTNARAHFNEEFASHTSENIESFVDTWFSDETQQVIVSLVAHLQSRK